MPNAKKWGYDEFKAAACAVKALNSLVELDGLKPNLIIRPHPKEDKKDLKKHLDSCDIQFKWSFDKAPDPDVTISKCRFIFGMSSMLLIEAALANRAVASVQPGLASEDPFVFSRWGYCELIKDAGHLRRYILKKIADGAKTTAVSKRFIRGNMNSSGRVARLLLSYEKRN
jgi:hypothetical protein